jgi:hypothetical protein
MDYVIYTDVGILVKVPHEPDDPVSLHLGVLRIVLPVGTGGGARGVCRQINEIGGAGILDVKESLLPGTAGFQAGKLVEGARLAGRNDACLALNWGFGVRKLLILDRVDPKIIEASKSINGGKEANEGLHERNVTREVEDGIARKVGRLELVKIQELTEEIRSRKAEGAL